MNIDLINLGLLGSIILVIALIVSFVLRKMLTIFISKYAEKIQADSTNFSFIKNSISFIVFSSAIVFIFYEIAYLKSIGTLILI